MVWNGVIATYLFLAGLGAGVFVFGVLAFWKNPEARKTKLAALVISLVAVGIGCLLLMVDARAGFMHLGRFFLLVSNLHSVMSWGVMLLVLFMLTAFIELIIHVRGNKAPRWLDVLGIADAVGVAMYTGLLLGVADAFPLWHPVILPLLFTVSAAGTGFAAGILGGYAVDRAQFEKLAFYRRPLFALPIIEIVLIVLLLVTVAATSGSAATAANDSVVNLVSGRYALAFWLGLMGVGLLFPFAAELVSSRRHVGDDGSTKMPGMMIAGETGVLIGGFLLRYLVIMAAVPIVAMM